MKKCQYLIGMCLLFLSSNYAFSANVVGMDGYQVPSSVGVFPDGKIEVNFPNVFNSRCENGDGRRIYIQRGNAHNITDQSILQIQSIVLAAHAANKPIKFWYYRDGTSCLGGKVVVSN